MPPKRKADEMESSSSKGKKTTVSTKTTVTTVTVEEPPTSGAEKKKSKKNDAAAALESGKKKANQPKALKAPDAGIIPSGSYYPALGGPPSYSMMPGHQPPRFPCPPMGSIQPPLPFGSTYAGGFPSFPVPTGVMGGVGAGGAIGGKLSPIPKMLPPGSGGGYPAAAYQQSMMASASSGFDASGQMPMQAIDKPKVPGKKALPPSSAPLALPAPSSFSAALMESGNKKKAAQGSSGGGKFVWLIYHKSGRCDAQLMGVYTGARTALKNAKAVIERETGGAEKRMKEEADLSDFSPNIQSDQGGAIYEVKYKNGGKNVVSFKKVKLNENLIDDDVEDEDEDADEDDVGGGVFALPPTGNAAAAALMAANRAAIGWM